MTKSLKRSIDEVNVNCRKLKREIIQIIFENKLVFGIWFCSYPFIYLLICYLRK